jgi:hypothetical protein
MARRDDFVTLRLYTRSVNTTGVRNSDRDGCDRLIRS